MGYSAVVLGVSVFLVLVYGIGEVGNLNFSFFRQPFFFLQSLVLAGLLVAVFWRKAKARGLLGENLRYRIFFFTLLFFVSSALLSIVNKVWIVRSFERDARVVRKTIRSPWGEKGRSSRAPVCAVEIASGIEVDQTIIGLLDCEIWNRLDPNLGIVHVKTDIGVTGLEFSKILKVDTTHFEGLPPPVLEAPIPVSPVQKKKR